MRISDWSSDVCSSDLIVIGHFSEPRAFDVEYRFSPRNGTAFVPRKAFVRNFALVIEEKSHSPTGVRFEGTSASVRYIRHGKVEWDNVTEKNHRQLRSEEQTSELQSLMRISYAVF